MSSTCRWWEGDTLLTFPSTLSARQTHFNLSYEPAWDSRATSATAQRGSWRPLVGNVQDRAKSLGRVPPRVRSGCRSCGRICVLAVEWETLEPGRKFMWLIHLTLKTSLFSVLGVRRHLWTRRRVFDQRPLPPASSSWCSLSKVWYKKRATWHCLYTASTP